MHILQFPLKLSVGEKILEDLIVAQTNLLKFLETSSWKGLKGLALLMTAYLALSLIIEKNGFYVKYLKNCKHFYGA